MGRPRGEAPPWRGGRLGGTRDGRAMHRHATGKVKATHFDGEKTQKKALLFVLASGHPIRRMHAARGARTRTSPSPLS